MQIDLRDLRQQIGRFFLTLKNPSEVRTVGAKEHDV